ncbi:MAG: insulinase family protein [Puniceicoccales bacterium]|jgi:zinc protease|nr:insulinase family protein [Puniceicoccales bacterium]
MSTYIPKYILFLPGIFFFHGCDFSPKEVSSIPFSLKKTSGTLVDFPLRHDPQIIFGQLDNGFHYALMRHTYPEKRVAMALNFDVGSAMEENHERGLAHFLEHMAFRGSKHFPDGTIISHMQNLGIAFGHDINAYTSLFDTCYELDLPNTHSDTVTAAFSAFSDFCSDLTIAESDVQQERGVVLSEKRDHKNVLERFSNATLKFFWEGTIIPNRKPIGKTEVIQQATARDLRQFYEKWYSPDKMFLVAVGDLDPQQFQVKIQETFGNLKAKASPPTINIGDLVVKRRKFFYFVDPDIPYSGVEVLSLFPDLFPEDHYKARRYQFLLNYVTSILFERLSDQKSEKTLPFIGVRTLVAKNYLKTGYSMFNAEITGVNSDKNWARYLKLLEQEVRRICQYGITDEELQRQKTILSNKLEKEVLSAKTRSSTDLVAEIVRCHSDHTFCLSPEDSLRLVKTINEDCSVKECQEAFREICKNLCVIVVTNQPIENALQTIESTFEQSESVPVEPYPDKPLGQFAYEHFDTPYQDITQRNEIHDLNVTQLTLANGVKVNLKPTDFEQHRINIALTVGQGLLTRYPHPQQGIFSVTAELFSRAGLVKNPWQQLGKIIELKNFSLDFSIDKLEFSFLGMCDKKNLLFGLQLLTAYLFDFDFEEHALNRVRNTLKCDYENRNKTSFSVLVDAYQKFITGNDAIMGLPSEASVFSITMKDVKNLLADVFQKEAVELTIVGDFDLQTAIQNIQDTFGALPPRSPSQDTPLDTGIFKFPENTPEKSFFFSGDEERALILGTFLTDDENNVQDRRYLNVLAKIIENRIRTKIRSEAGDAYSIKVNHTPTPFKNFGLLEILLSLDPQRIASAKNEILDIIEDLKKNPVSQDELHCSKSPLLKNVRDSFRRNDFWLCSIMHAHRRPQDLENLRTLRAFYENITAQNLHQTAQKYLNHPVWTTICPKPSAQDTENLTQDAKKVD